MAKNILVISCDIRETRVALIEDGIIAELHIERRGNHAEGRYGRRRLPRQGHPGPSRPAGRVHRHRARARGVPPRRGPHPPRRLRDVPRRRAQARARRGGGNANGNGIERAAEEAADDEAAERAEAEAEAQAEAALEHARKSAGARRRRRGPTHHDETPRPSAPARTAHRRGRVDADRSRDSATPRPGTTELPDDERDDESVAEPRASTPAEESAVGARWSSAVAVPPPGGHRPRARGAADDPSRSTTSSTTRTCRASPSAIPARRCRARRRRGSTTATRRGDARARARARAAAASAAAEGAIAVTAAAVTRARRGCATRVRAATVAGGRDRAGRDAARPGPHLQVHAHPRRRAGGPGDHRPDHEGAHRHQGRPLHEPHLAAGPLRRVPADGRARRHVSKRIGSDKERARLRETIESMKPPTRRPHRAHGGRGPHEEAAQAGRRLPRAPLGRGREEARGRAGAGEPLERARPRAEDGARPLHRRGRPDRHRRQARSTSASCRFVEMFMPERAEGHRSTTARTSPSSTPTASRTRSAARSSRKVPLPCGGYLIIDQAEALTAIDVNTGRFVGKGSRTWRRRSSRRTSRPCRRLPTSSASATSAASSSSTSSTWRSASNREKVRQTLEELLAEGQGQDDAEPHLAISASSR